MSQPLLFAMPVRIIVFTTTEQVKTALAPSNLTSFEKGLIAGSLAGVMSLSVVVPQELLKCRAQMNKNSPSIRYTDEVAKLWSQQGVRGLYRGFSGNALRDIP